MVNTGSDLASRPEFVSQMQAISHRIAFEPASWSEGLAGEIRAIFDSRAPDWSSHDTPGYVAPLEAAIDVAGISGGICLDVGAGTTIQEQVLSGRFDGVVALDISAEMLALADPGGAHLVRADASQLPIRDAVIDVIVCVNMFLFVAEYSRVLNESGAIVFVSTSGTGTPIYLDPDDVAKALRLHGDQRFETTTGTIGPSCWTVARRQHQGAR